LAALTTAGAVTWGAAAAVIWLTLGRAVRRGLLAAAVIALALPPFLVANCWLPILGPSGWLQDTLLGPRASFTAFWLEPLVSLASAAGVMSLMFWPVSFLWTVGAWQRLQKTHLELEPRLAGWALLRWWLWPAARGPLGQAALLTFVLALNHFAVPALFQVKVYPAEVWIRFSTHLDVWGALVTSAPLVMSALLLLVWWRRREVSWPRSQLAGGDIDLRRRLGPAASLVLGAVAAAVLGLSLVLPLGQLLGDPGTWSELGGAVRAGTAAWMSSAILAVVSATLMVAVSVAAARVRCGPWLWLPFLLPGVLVGIGCILVFNRPPFLLLFHSLGIVVVAWVVRYLAVPWTATARGLQAVDRRLVDVIRLEGGSRRARFRLVEWPQAGGLMLAGWYVAFLLCLWDTETLVLIQPPGGETLALRIFNFLHYGHNAQVNALCLLLLLLALLPLLLWMALGRWIGGGALRRQRGAQGIHGLCPHTPSLSRRTGDGRGENSPKPFAHCAPEQAGRDARPRASRPSRREEEERRRLAGLPTSDAPVHGEGGGYMERLMESRSLQSFAAPWAHPLRNAGFPAGMTPTGMSALRWWERRWLPVARRAAVTVAGALAAAALSSCAPASDTEAPVRSALFARVQVIGTRGTGLGQFNKPRSVAIDSQDRLYVVDMTARVQRFSAAGDYEACWQMPQTDLGKPKGMCRDEQGNVVVLEPHYAKVNHFSPAGKLIEQWGREGTNAGEFYFPRSVAVTPQGAVYVSEYGRNERVQLFGRDRTLVRVLGGAGRGPGQFNRPEGVCLDARGQLHVADSCNHRVQVFGADGRFLRSYGTPGSGPGEMSYPYDVRVDAAGRQYVCEFGNSRIQVWGADGKCLETLGGLGSAPGQLHNPWSIALDSRGNLYVADAMNHRVQKFVRRI